MPADWGLYVALLSLFLNSVIVLTGVAFRTGVLKREVENMREAVTELQKNFVTIRDTIVQEKDIPLYLKPLLVVLDTLDKRVGILENSK